MELAGEEKKEYKSINGYTCTFLIWKKSQQWGKRHLKMQSFTHTILLLVALSADKQKQLSYQTWSSLKL